MPHTHTPIRSAYSYVWRVADCISPIFHSVHVHRRSVALHPSHAPHTHTRMRSLHIHTRDVSQTAYDPYSTMYMYIAHLWYCNQVLSHKHTNAFCIFIRVTYRRLMWPLFNGVHVHRRSVALHLNHATHTLECVLHIPQCMCTAYGNWRVISSIDNLNR